MSAMRDSQPLGDLNGVSVMKAVSVSCGWVCDRDDAGRAYWELINKKQNVVLSSVHGKNEQLNTNVPKQAHIDNVIRSF